MSFPSFDVNSRTKFRNQSTPCVALVGNTGVGKSTLVNVLMGREVAKANNDALPCTTQTEKYTLREGGVEYCHILDTRGLNEASEKTALVSRILRSMGILQGAEREVRKVLRGKDPKLPSVDLVLLCISADKIRTGVNWKIYDKIFVDFCEKRLTVAVVVTQIGGMDFRGSEWKKTCQHMAMGVVEEFPDAGLIEGVPMFEELSDPSLRVCRGRILRIISNTCRRRPTENVVGHY